MLDLEVKAPQLIHFALDILAERSAQEFPVACRRALQAVGHCTAAVTRRRPLGAWLRPRLSFVLHACTPLPSSATITLFVTHALKDAPHRAVLAHSTNNGPRQEAGLLCAPAALIARTRMVMAQQAPPSGWRCRARAAGPICAL